MPSVWERATVVAPERLAAVDDATVLLDRRTRYAVLPESGWGALVGWLAGADRLLGCRDDLADHRTVTTEERGGSVTVSVRPRSPADQALVDEDIDGYLTAAGAEPRSPGLRWFVRLPEGVPADRLWKVANDAGADAPPHPSALVRPVGAALRALYGA